MPRTANPDHCTVAVPNGSDGLLIGVDDGTLGELSAIEDRLQVSGEWIKSDVTVSVKQ